MLHKKAMFSASLYKSLMYLSLVAQKGTDNKPRCTNRRPPDWRCDSASELRRDRRRARRLPQVTTLSEQERNSQRKDEQTDCFMLMCQRPRSRSGKMNRLSVMIFSQKVKSQRSPSETIG